MKGSAISTSARLPNCSLFSDTIARPSRFARVEGRIEDRDLPAGSGHALGFAEHGAQVGRVVERGIEQAMSDGLGR